MSVSNIIWFSIMMFVLGITVGIDIISIRYNIELQTSGPYWLIAEAVIAIIITLCFIALYKSETNGGN